MKPTTTYLVLLITISINLFSQVTYTESFDGTTFVPTGWTNLAVSGSNTWTRVTAGTFPTQSPHSGVGEAKFNSFSVNNGVRALVSPVINMIARGSATTSVSFWMYRDDGYSTNADKIDVYMNTSASLTGAGLLGTVNRASNMSPTVSANGWYQYTYTVAASYSTTTNYLIIKATSTYGNNIFIDDVSWTAFPPATIDMSAIALASPVGNFDCFSSNETVSITVKNNGTASINFVTNPVTITTSVSIPSSVVTTASVLTLGSFVLNTGTLAAGATKNISVTNSFNMLLNGTYTFSSSTSVTGDVNNTNNAMAATSIVVSKVGNFPYQVDFSAIPTPVFLTQQVSGSGVWTNATSGNMSNPSLTPVSGAGFAYFNSYLFSSGTVANLITPSFDMTNVSSPKLDLWVSQDAGYSSSLDKLDIMVSTDGGQTWSSSIQTIQRYNSTYTTAGWKVFSVSLFAYSGMPCVRIAIQGTSDYGNNIAIDNLKVYDAGTILPVKLVDFTGNIYSDQENLLTWRTEAEVNTKLFKIQRSTDGINFTTIYSENASGEQGGKSYYFIDNISNEAMPVAYYQLVSVDNDNTSETFKIITINRNYQKKYEAVLYPNPSAGNTTLKIGIEQEAELRIDIMNVNGTIVSSEVKHLMAGENHINVISENFQSGIYYVDIVCLSNNTKKTSLKLIIM